MNCNTKKQSVTRLAILIAIPLAVGLIASAITGDAMLKYGNIIQPKLAPPAWLFPIAWTILYILMGLGSYFLFRFPAENDIERSYKRQAILIFFIQLALNFAWSFFFFIGEMYLFSFVWLLILWAMIIALIVKSFKVR